MRKLPRGKLLRGHGPVFADGHVCIGGVLGGRRKLVLELRSRIFPVEHRTIELHSVQCGAVASELGPIHVHEVRIWELLQLDGSDIINRVLCCGLVRCGRIVGLLELRCGHVLCGRDGDLYELRRGQRPSEHWVVKLRELCRGHFPGFDGRDDVRGLSCGYCARRHGCGGVGGLRGLRCWDVLGGVGDSVRELRGGAVRGDDWGVGVLELRDGHLCRFDWIGSMRELRVGHVSGVDGVVSVIGLRELRCGPVLGRGRERVHKLLGRDVLGIGWAVGLLDLRGGDLLDDRVDRVHGVLGGDLPTVNWGVSLPDVRLGDILGGGRVGVRVLCLRNIPALRGLVGVR